MKGEKLPDDVVERIKAQLRGGDTAVKVAVDNDVAKKTVFRIKKRMAGEPAPLMPMRRTAAIEQPEEPDDDDVPESPDDEGGASDAGEEIESLRQRVVELEGFALETAMENTKLRRLLQARS